MSMLAMNPSAWHSGSWVSFTRTWPENKVAPHLHLQIKFRMRKPPCVCTIVLLFLSLALVYSSNQSSCLNTKPWKISSGWCPQWLSMSPAHPVHQTTAVIHLQPIIYPLCLHATTMHPLVACTFPGMSSLWKPYNFSSTVQIHSMVKRYMSQHLGLSTTSQDIKWERHVHIFKEDFSLFL